MLLSPSVHCADDQQMRGLECEGYVTALHLPAGFDVDGQHIILTPGTGYGLENDTTARVDSPLKNKLQLGAYVFVLGDPSLPTKSNMARAVLFRDERNRTLSGIGVIDKVISSGPEPIYRADGYLIRVSASTQMTFKDSLNSLADVTTNAWIVFEGRRDADGILVATRATFLPPKPTRFKAAQRLEVSTVKVKPASATGSDSTQSGKGTIGASGDGASLKEDEQLKIGPLGHWHTVPADQPLQLRVERVGMSLIPAYQRSMADDDPSKIHFRFFAVDYKGARSEICLLDGVVLLPTQMLERIQNDDQLAAVLADGVAYNLQRQAAKTVTEIRKSLIFSAATGSFASLGVGMLAGGLLGSNSAFWADDFLGIDPLTQMQEDRARISLALMQDAGYDPRQAPEAWRLLAPRKLPKDPAKLGYPEVSGYQFNVLNMQYRSTSAAESSTGLPAGKTRQ
jgi:hypothetical protein